MMVRTRWASNDRIGSVMTRVVVLTFGWAGGVLGQEAASQGPWDMRTLARPPACEILERPRTEVAKPVFFTGPEFQGKQTRVFAWLGVPEIKDGAKIPGIVLVHGGGGTAFEEWVGLWVRRGYAAIAVDTCGQIPVGRYGRWVKDPEGGPPGWGGFDQIDRPQRDQWTYQAVAKVVLAHSLLRAQKGVDPERTGVTGISWGGYLTCIVAGVDPRFKFAVPVYGCGFYRRTVFMDQLDRLAGEQAKRWLEWWDPSVYLKDASIPILWVTGSNDFAYPLDALQQSYRTPTGTRTLCVRLRMPHGHGGAGENPEEIRVFADSILKAAPPLPRVTGQGRKGRDAWATFDAKVGLTRAELKYTRDVGRWQDRRWESVPANLEGTRATASLPDQTRVYYLNVLDERGCVVSTEHEECASP